MSSHYRQQHIDSIGTDSNSFVAGYTIQYLIYYEKFTWIQEAIAREKELKSWRREKKDNLIKSFNENL